MLAPALGRSSPLPQTPCCKPLRSILDGGPCFFSEILSAATLPPRSSWNRIGSLSGSGRVTPDQPPASPWVLAPDGMGPGLTSVFSPVLESSTFSGCRLCTQQLASVSVRPVYQGGGELGGLGLPRWQSCCLSPSSAAQRGPTELLPVLPPAVWKLQPLVHSGPVDGLRSP